MFIYNYIFVALRCDIKFLFQYTFLIVGYIQLLFNVLAICYYLWIELCILIIYNYYVLIIMSCAKRLLLCGHTFTLLLSTRIVYLVLSCS